MDALSSEYHSDSEVIPLTDNGGDIITTTSITSLTDTLPSPFPLSSDKNINQYPVKKIFLIYTLLTFIFAFIGGVIFRVCEFEAENDQIIEKRMLYAKISNALPSTTEYKETLDKLITHYSDVPLELEDNRWSLSRSVFFAFTSATTIGYGYSAPQTPMGKLATFLYGTQYNTYHIHFTIN